jgi:predicted membrane-bound mannosyltransferase
MFKSGRGGSAGSTVFSISTLAALALAVWIVAFWRLGTPSFWDPDEAHYAETTRELIGTGDWTAPYYNERPFFDKPILFHWLQAIPMLLLGPSTLSARLVPAMAAVGLIGVTMWVGVALLSSGEAAVVAALLMATSATRSWTPSSRFFSSAVRPQFRLPRCAIGRACSGPATWPSRLPC